MCTATGGQYQSTAVDDGAGTPNVASDVSVDGATYNVYSQQRTDSGNSWNLIMFVTATATTSVSNLDFGDFSRDAVGSRP